MTDITPAYLRETASGLPNGSPAQRALFDAADEIDALESSRSHYLHLADAYARQLRIDLDGYPRRETIEPKE